MQVKPYSNGVIQKSVGKVSPNQSLTQDSKKRVAQQEKSLSRVSSKQRLSTNQSQDKSPSSKTVDKKKPKDDLDELLGNTQPKNVSEDVDSMFNNSDPVTVAKGKATKEINFIFEPRFYEGEIHYSRDGSSEFNSSDNAKKRAELKTNSLVQEAVNSVMDVYTFDRDGSLTKPEYIKVQTCIARILRQDLKENSIERLLEEDWKHDSQQKGFMNRKEVFDSLFELGDIWTPDIDAYQYVVFFEKLSKILKGEEELKNNPKTRIVAVAN
jgi:hypothetical protein